jgi:hypothetical protein
MAGQTNSLAGAKQAVKKAAANIAGHFESIYTG